METRIVHCKENIDEMKVKSSKKLIEKVLSYIVKTYDFSYHSLKLWGNTELGTI